MVTLQSLPTEIVSKILECCDTSRELAVLASTCRWLYDMTIPVLYDRQALENDYHVIFWAARNAPKGHVETVQFLLDQDVDIDAPSLCYHEERFPFEESCWTLDFGDRANFDVLPLATFTPLILSIFYKHEPVTQLLLGQGASTEIMVMRHEAPSGTTALHAAVASGNVPAIKMIIEGGHAGPNDLDAAGYPPLLWAALHASKNQDAAPSLQALVDLGADPDYIVPSGITRDSRHSMVATLTKRGKPEAAEMLVAVGAKALSDEELRELENTAIMYL
ncbi:ankyrin [Fusarium albosuccineum]|uniref:Ankyrin n=1 Tax=Fusarium albosuccineum TaxID=1237068 RepID=A0A8H4PA11_9HYPO|nr:ankyrin [Fusarium albosuccineum]